jgi:hypothetical protein
LSYSKARRAEALPEEGFVQGGGVRVGVISVYMDYRRKGEKARGLPQPAVGPLIAGLLPRDIEIKVTNETWEDADWSRDYDLLFISSLHSDFDRARQIAHYWRRRGAKTVFGGTMASTYPGLCQPFFDAVVVGDPEGSVRQVFDDFRSGELKPLYVSASYDGTQAPVPRFDLVAGKHVVPLSFEATRGCPYNCEFCALAGIGTRFHVRPAQLVVRDIQEGQRMLRDLVPWPQRRMVAFLDNNIGGNPAYLSELCDALAPLRIRWGSAITLNALALPGMVERLARSGCRVAVVGLESFNPEAILDMQKFQNALDQTRFLIERCRRNGVLLESGLMVSPMVDDWSYIQTIPQRLREAGLHIPAYICFEGPIPGTPCFKRLAAGPEPAFLPDAYLRDFSGYTLVVRPKREPVETFIQGYQWVMDNTYTRMAKLRKYVDDVPPLLSAGSWGVALGDVVSHWNAGHVPRPDRTYLAGTDVPPPEATSVPLTDDDFESEAERSAILDPWRVTDAEGRVLPAWLDSIRVFEGKGRLSAQARGLIAAPVSGGVA